MKTTSWLHSLSNRIFSCPARRGIGRRLGCKTFGRMSDQQCGLYLAFAGETLEDRALLASKIGMDTSGGTTFTTSASQTLGYQFATSRPLVIDGLGVFDVSANGLVTSHPVGIFRADGSTLRIITVPGGGGAPLVTSASAIGDWRVANTSPLELTPGNYVVSAFYSSGVPDQLVRLSSALPASGISFTVAKFALSGGPSFPASTAPADAGAFFGPTFRVADVDYGDAPTAAQSSFASSYPTTFANNGARHIIAGPRFGFSVDADDDGQAAANAAGDVDDGVTFAGGTIGAKFIANGTAQVIINLQNAAAANQVDAWVDFNRDGDWNDIDEQILTNVALGTVNGTFAKSFSVPQDTGANFVAGVTFARIRLSTTGGLSPTGLANDGEIEDLRVTLANFNAVPTVANSLADQNATEDAAFSFQFAADAFADADADEGDLLTLTATKLDGTPLPSWLTFTAATRTFSGTPGNDDVGNVDVTVTATDIGNASASDTFRISVGNVNDVPSFTKGPNVATSGDGAARTITGWATNINRGPGNESGQALDFQVSIPPANATLFNVAPAISSDGALTFTPKAAATGIVNVNVKIHDDGGTDNGGVDTSAVQTFTIALTGLNKAPSFTKGANPSVSEDAGSQTINGWAKSINAGAGEVAQTVSFVVTNNNNALFSTQPAISPTGVLTYTPVANANGTATVTVVLQDNGGTAGGGKDATTTTTFTITVKPVNDAPLRTAGVLPVISVDEDSTNNTAVTLGLNGLTYVSGPATATDEAAQTLAYKITAIPKSVKLFKADGTTAVNLNGTVTAAELLGLKFKTVANLFGVGDLKFTVTDNGGGSAPSVNVLTETVSVTVNPLNDAPPTISNIADVTINEDASTAAIKFTVDDADDKLVNLNAVIVTTTSSNPALIPTNPANIVLGGSLGSRTIQLKPLPDQFGLTTITVTATDSSGATATDSFLLTVNAVNDAPRITVATLSVPEFTTNNAVVGTVAAVDPEGHAITAFAITGGNTGNAFKIDNAGVLQVADATKIDFEALGRYVLTVKATDALGIAGAKITETGPITINVENQSFQLAVAALDLDNTLTVSKVGNNLIARRGLVDVITPTPLEDVASLTINGGTAKDTVVLEASLNSAGSPATKKFTGQIIFNGNDGDDRLEASKINVATFGITSARSVSTTIS